MEDVGVVDFSEHEHGRRAQNDLIMAYLVPGMVFPRVCCFAAA